MALPGTDLPETPAGPYHRRKCHPVDRHAQTRTSSLSPPAHPASFHMSNSLPTEATTNQPHITMNDRAWQSASHIERAPQREKKPAGGTTPPAPGK